jgi:activator of HSP90 ATPase
VSQRLSLQNHKPQIFLSLHFSPIRSLKPMTVQFTTTALIPAQPAAIYTAWLDSEGHRAMTGAEATCSVEIEGAFQAWGGYIEGRNLELQENERIVQAWRTSEFSESEPDSRVEVTLKVDGDETEVTITHTGLPEHGMQYLQGWADFYFTPMIAYFSQV